MGNFWDQFKTWDEAEKAWDGEIPEAAKKSPLKLLRTYPTMQGITPDTAKNLRWKSFKWMVMKDRGAEIFLNVMRRPFTHAFNYLKSLFSSRPFTREGDFFLYGIASKEEFVSLLQKQNSLLILGFSYCHKPFECPSGRFTDQCIRDPENSVCRQCFIGKASNAIPEEGVVPVYIPTVHDIGRKVFELKRKHPEKEIIFLITACEMTLTMFADWGNLAGIRGVGVRLDGRICNTMKAFEISEEGIKPGLTVVLDKTQEQMLAWLKISRETRKGRND